MIQLEKNPNSAGLTLPKSFKTRFHDNPVLAEAEVQAIRQGFVFSEFTDDRGWEIQGKLQNYRLFSFIFTTVIANLLFSGYTSSGNRSILTGPGMATAQEIGCTYIGHFKDNNPHGYGEATWTDGSSYKGNWMDGHHEGMGTAVYPGDGTYTGNFSASVREGTGVFCWLDGEKYEGEYKDGEQHGQGSIIRPNGLVLGGEFKQGDREGVCYNLVTTTGAGMYGLFNNGAFNG